MSYLIFACTQGLKSGRIHLGLKPPGTKTYQGETTLYPYFNAGNFLGNTNSSNRTTPVYVLGVSLVWKELVLTCHIHVYKSQVCLQSPYRVSHDSTWKKFPTIYKNVHTCTCMDRCRCTCKMKQTCKSYRYFFYVSTKST